MRHQLQKVIFFFTDYVGSYTLSRAKIRQFSFIQNHHHGLNYGGAMKAFGEVVENGFSSSPEVAGSEKDYTDSLARSLGSLEAAENAEKRNKD